MIKTGLLVQPQWLSENSRWPDLISFFFQKLSEKPKARHINVDDENVIFDTLGISPSKPSFIKLLCDR